MELSFPAVLSRGRAAAEADSLAVFAAEKNIHKAAVAVAVVDGMPSTRVAGCSRMEEHYVVAAGNAVGVVVDIGVALVVTGIGSAEECFLEAQQQPVSLDNILALPSRSQSPEGRT
jgi:hypothetical protein